MNEPLFFEERNDGTSAYSMLDMAFRNRSVFIEHGIDKAVAGSVIKQLMLLDSLGEEEITVYINSPGGSVMEGLAIYDALQLTKSPVTTVCFGYAASMGAILFLAGDKRIMLPHSKLMVHDPVSVGTENTRRMTDVQEEYESLLKCRDELVKIISERTGLKQCEVKRITKKDTWLNATEAIAKGFATGIVEYMENGRLN